MTSLRLLTPRDRPALETLLDSHRASSMFLRSNLFQSGLQDRPEPFHGLYMGAYEGRALTDVAAHYWNNCIILQAPTRPVELALAVARESGRPVAEGDRVSSIYPTKKPEHAQTGTGGVEARSQTIQR